MGQVSVPVDLLNPGQVFACIGLLEAADVLCGPAEGGFDWSEEPRFKLKASTENPMEDVLNFLAAAEIAAIAPAMTELADEYGLPTCRESEPVSPSPELKASVLPVVLRDQAGREIQLSHWSESSDSAAGLDNVKFWGGAGGYSGAARTRDLQQAFISKFAEARSEVLGAPFDASGRLSNGFRLDMRRDYVPIDVGFSPNNHSSMEIVGFPLVELLAAIGLQHARPARVSRLEYRYAVWSHLLPPLMARPALGGGLDTFPLRRFSMKLGQPNKFDRSILFAVEEAHRD